MSNCIFEYRYRDAGNWKTEAAVILFGQIDTTIVDGIRKTLEAGELFIPEQVGLKPLQNQHFLAHKTDPDDDMDHAFHEFIGVRAIESKNDMQHPKLAITLEYLAAQFEAAGKQGWNVSISPFSEC
ncbi:hypothetical protein [Thermomonas sp.]|uniref:hypothetical protein n=1 Tax=Thermomonas sp. TaxID=1971895 RepID=UPI00391BE57B